MSAPADQTDAVSRAIEMRAAGHTLAEIAAALGVHLTTVHKWTAPVVGTRAYVRDGRRVTLNLRRESKRSLMQASFEVPLSEHPRAGHGRPATYGECRARGLGASTPCPYVSCAHHLALDVDDTGTITSAWLDADEAPDLEAMVHTCSLRVADDGGLQLSRERVRQIEATALDAAARMLRADGVRSVDDVAPGLAWCGAREVHGE